MHRPSRSKLQRDAARAKSNRAKNKFDDIRIQNIYDRNQTLCSAQWIRFLNPGGSFDNINDSFGARKRIIDCADAAQMEAWFATMRIEIVHVIDLQMLLSNPNIWEFLTRRFPQGREALVRLQTQIQKSNSALRRLDDLLFESSKQIHKHCSNRRLLECQVLSFHQRQWLLAQEDAKELETCWRIFSSTLGSPISLKGLKHVRFHSGKTYICGVELEYQNGNSKTIGESSIFCNVSRWFTMPLNVSCYGDQNGIHCFKIAGEYFGYTVAGDLEREIHLDSSLDQSLKVTFIVKGINVVIKDVEII